MTTPHTRALVSATVALSLTLAFGACVRHQSRPAGDGAATLDRRREPLNIRFDNTAREHVHVYLVTVERQWLLGRVEPGARATLEIPEASLRGSAGFARLAVLTGERITPQVARDPRATFTIAQPASAIVSQRWMFSDGQLNSLGVWGSRPPIDRR
jgi:hypothetical protein